MNIPSKKRIKILIICSLDKFTNEVRAKETKKFLERKGYTVKLFNLFSKNEYLSLTKSIYSILKNICPHFFKQRLLIFQLKLNAILLARKINKEVCDVVICDDASASFIFTKNLKCLKIYNCPTPLADELYYSKKLSKKLYLKLRDMELEVYRKTDYVSFREPYRRYVQKYIYSGKNIFVMDGGCYPKNQRAKFSYPPRIVYLGELGGYWTNLPLLSRITKIYKNIDVYGTPKPNKIYKLNYKGYANPDILSKYQFGLITITKDKLRRWGFSAKHPEYLSYGLPVLVPDWRKNLHLFKGSIPYNERDFLKKIKKYSNKMEWQKMSNEAYRQAKQYSWDVVLKPLGKIIDEYFKIN